jgi:hypothetical protein
MLNLKQSIRALSLAIKIVHRRAPRTDQEAEEFLALCRLGAGSPSLTDSALIKIQREKAKPQIPILLIG